MDPEMAGVAAMAQILREQLDDGELERGPDVRYEWDSELGEFQFPKRF